MKPTALPPVFLLCNDILRPDTLCLYMGLREAFTAGETNLSDSVLDVICDLARKVNRTEASKEN
jgi:hypothetical protein